MRVLKVQQINYSNSPEDSACMAKLFGPSKDIWYMSMLPIHPGIVLVSNVPYNIQELLITNSNWCQTVSTEAVQKTNMNSQLALSKYLFELCVHLFSTFACEWKPTEGDTSLWQAAL